MAAFVIILLALLNASATLQGPVAQNYTSEILRLAKVSQIKAYLNTDKDYCDNFYKYACGRWKWLQPAKMNATKTAYLDQLQDLYVRKSAEMLRGSRELDNSVDTMLKDFFESCRNEDALQQLGLEPILQLVDFRGGWPHVTSHTWYEYEYDWLKVVAELRLKLGVNILVGLDVVADYEDKDMHRIKVGAPRFELGLKSTYWDSGSEDLRKKYIENITQKLRKHFQDMSPTWAREVAQQVFDLEKQLTKGLPDNPKLTLEQASRQRYAAELKAAYGSYVDLNHYLNIIFNQTIYVQVYEHPEDYMSNLVEVIKQTPKLTIANYTMWRVLEHLDFAGQINAPHNDNWCVYKTHEYFPRQLQSMFHRNYNSMKMINELQSVWADIKKTFRDELLTSSKLSWITLNTRQKAVMKLDDIKLKVVTHEDDELVKEVDGLVLRRDKYYNNLINVLQWNTQHRLSELIQKPHESKADSILPKYVLTSNIIEVPITFLQSRFFWDPEYPSALKYSTLGFLLAHEMLHGFDAIGRRYDQHGYQRGWWDTVSEYAYDERAKCFEKHQYDHFEFRGNDVSGALAHAECILDSGALAIAYRSYEKWWENLADNEPILRKESLPLVDYSAKQIFFIGFAQLWCADYHKSQEHFNTLPESLRVNGALANFKEFAREMGCQLGSKMNPESKCIIY